MALKPLTVNTPPGQPAHLLAEDDAALYEGLLGPDCVLPVGEKMAASVLSNNKVRILDGVVVVGGHVARILKGDYEDMTIANGTSGQNRNDIIAARFLVGSDGGADTFKLEVLQGTPGATATDPVYVRGDLYSGDKQRDYPLWRIKLEGISIVKVEKLHEVSASSAQLWEKYTDLVQSLKTVAFSGSYADLTGRPTLGAAAACSVVNNGTTTAASTVLDGRMGKTLLDKINSLNSSLAASTVTLATVRGVTVRYKKNNHMCTVYASGKYSGAKISAYGTVTIGTLPAGCRPPGVMRARLHCNSTNLFMVASSGGTVYMMNDGWEDISPDTWLFEGALTFVL